MDNYFPMVVSFIINYDKNLFKNKIPIHKYLGILRSVNSNCYKYNNIYKEMLEIRKNVTYSIIKQPNFIVPTLEEIEKLHGIKIK